MHADLCLALLEQLPNPVLVKGADLRYIWINEAFESLFSVRRVDVIGQLDTEIFVDRQAAQCNGGDLRVLETGEVDHAEETIFAADGTPRDVITRKSRLILEDDSMVLVGVLHDVTTVSRLNRELELSQTKLGALADEMKRLSITDTLTGVRNRRGLDEAFAAEEFGALAMVDLDMFKQINDEHGHAVGDEALSQLANVMRDSLGRSDLMGRLGGDEFVVLLKSSEMEQNMPVLERMVEVIASTPLDINGTLVPLSVSVGVAARSDDATDQTSLMRYADQALFQAKQAGRNNVVAHGAGIPASSTN